MKYQYTHEPAGKVMQNPEEYIIPECLEACKILWGKGITTFMCSNYENVILYVSLEEDLLSEENRQIIYSSKEKEVFGRDIINGAPCIKASTSEELCKLANIFKMQDCMRYDTNEVILESYRRRGGKWEILDTGAIRAAINPERANATLEDALKEVDLSLYDAEEGKLFHDRFAFEHHMMFKKLQH